MQIFFSKSTVMKNVIYVFILFVIYSCTDTINDQPLIDTFIKEDTQYQFEENMKKYTSIPVENRNLFFHDDFNDNANDWFIGENKALNCSFKKGSYYIVTGSTGYFINFPVSINKNENFEISINYAFEDYNSKTGSGIIFGANDELTSFLFYNIGITSNSTPNYWIGEYENSTYSYWVDLSVRPLIKDVKVNNLLTVRKVKNKCYYFINKTYVFYTTLNNIYGDNLAIDAPSNCTMSVDYISIDYLLNL
jgi:hypothetical protein